MARRLPSRPPVLPGFSHLRVLGSGGFADVFLYEQNMPRRQVAVKVLLSEVVNDEVRRMFQAEANLMAQLSAHPSVLTVYQASVSSDGRPYIVMELCSSSLSTRYRAERLSVGEALRIAIRIGSAVETAHRAGVLHRDIKPSNILLTAYGHPVLSDFGIAATLGEMDGQETVGMSIPWSAPEVLLDETPGSVASEVWSLAATVYSLLAGRSPFEVPGGDNTSASLMARIGRARARAIDRPDVPASLERLIGSALSRKPDARPASVLDLITGFQAIETELGLSQTPVEVAMDEWANASLPDADDRTVVRAVAGSLASAPRRRQRRRAPKAGSTAAGLGAPARSGSARSGSARTGSARAGSSAVDSLVRYNRAAPSAGSRSGADTRRMRTLAWVLAGGAAIVIVLGILAASFIVRGSVGGTPVVSDISATVSGRAVTFAWGDPGLRESDAYSIRTGDGGSGIQKSREFSVDAQPGSRVCITVTVNRDGKPGEPSGEKCVDVAS